MKPSPLPVRMALLLAALILVCGSAVPQTRDDVTLAREIAQEIIASCPLTVADDEAARDRSADRLAKSALLRGVLKDPIFWGGQRPAKSYLSEEYNLTLFNPFVWRRLYLSLFMFPGAYSIERVDTLTILHLPCRFRNEMDAGAYPYPFWHSQKKWNNYQRATEVLLVIEDGKVIAGYRSGTEDPDRATVPRQWDGMWRWTDQHGNEMPYAALYRYLFSDANPHVSRLDAAYRALEAEARQYNCVICHSPANPAAMNPLRLLNLPNQALTGRHQIEQVLAENRMPPIGIEDDAQRKKLLTLAQDFAAIGDQALDYEREFKPGE